MSQNANSSAIRGLTLNVMADLRAHEGFERWDRRRALCARVLTQANVDLIGLQECIGAQQGDLVALLPEFEGITGDLSGADTALREEFLARAGFELPITGELLTLFRRDTFECLERREAWMSPTPDRVSTGFGQRSPRSLLALRLRHRASARELWAVNSRLDHQFHEPMAAVAVRVLDEWIADLPALWFGDFNAGLGTATAGIIRDAGWMAPRTPLHAYHGERTEHIWRRGPGLELVDCQIIESGGFTPALSDHDPVLAQFGLARG